MSWHRQSHLPDARQRHDRCVGRLGRGRGPWSSATLSNGATSTRWPAPRPRRPNVWGWFLDSGWNQCGLAGEHHVRLQLDDGRPVPGGVTDITQVTCPTSRAVMRWARTPPGRSSSPEGWGRALTPGRPSAHHR